MQERFGASSWRAKSRGPTFVLLALVGTWISHTTQYAIGHGTAGLGPVAGRVHLYMVPAGVVLAALSMAVAIRWSHTVLALKHRLSHLRRALKGKRRGTYPLDRVVATRTGPVGPLGLWLALAVTQVGLYLFQENAEAHAAGVRMPGLAVVGAARWTAIPVHLIVALFLATAFAAFHRKAAQLAETVEAHVKLWLWMTRHRVISQPLPAGAAGVTLTPLQRWGRQRWQRPPPAVAASW